MTGILRPTDHFTAAVGPRGKAVVSAQGRQRSHLAAFPNEPEIDITDVVRPRIESEATPPLPQRLRRGSLGNTHDDAAVVLHVPGDIAVWSAEGAKVLDRAGCTISPQGGMATRVSPQVC